MFSTHRNAVAVAPNPWKVPTNTAARESVKRRPSRGGFLIGVLSSAALVAGFIGVSSAASAAGSGTVMATTHASNHPDTCSCTTNVTSSNGDVWAYDNLSRKFTVTPETGPGNYQVVIVDHGSFAAFAEPNNPDLSTFYPIKATGSIDGTITYDVQSSTPPDPSALPAQEPSDATTSEMISALFDGNATIVGGGAYTYTYKAGGETYTQTSTSPYITGDIT
jgi:hypothetical protein